MLRYKADIKTLIWMFATTATFVILWQLSSFSWLLYIFYLYLSIAVTTIAHNHNHVPMWRSKFLNTLTDYWLTVFYGFPSFAWIPTHNMNHHSLNNRAGDYTITYRFTENNTLLMLLTYPSISAYYQQKPISNYLKLQWKTNRPQWYFFASQYVLLAAWIGVALFVDWQKALLFVIIPQQIATFSVLVFNYIQHVHADEESEWNHSRNVEGFLNKMLFNNGLHTAHHERSGLHWSVTPELHAKIAPNIDPTLMERSFWWYIFRVYFLGAVMPKYRTTSMRQERIKRQQMAGS